MSETELVVIAAFPDPMEAELAKSALQSAGIDCMIQADTAGGMRPHLAVGTGGYRILVRAEDADAAREVLNPSAT
jgi:hypothetical protein